MLVWAARTLPYQTDLSVVHVQAAQGPDADGMQIDPDLQSTTFELALLNGNETAYELVLEAFTNVRMPVPCPHHCTCVILS